MGSYNETCALTHLPIENGDDVVFLVLEQQERFAEKAEVGVYPGYFWAPCVLPIYAKYDDFGRVEPDDSKHILDSVLGQYKQELRDRPDDGVLREHITFPLLLDWFQSGLVYTQFHTLRSYPNIPILIRRGVWDSIVNRGLLHWSWPDQGTASLDQIMARVDPWFDALLKAEGTERFKLCVQTPKEKVDPLAEIWALAWGESSIGEQIKSSIQTNVLDAMHEEAFDRDIFRVQIQRFAELQLVHKFFRTARLTWAPTTGGSQRDDPMPALDYHMLCAKEAMSVVRSQRERLDEANAKEQTKVIQGYRKVLSMRKSTP